MRTHDASKRPCDASKSSHDAYLARVHACASCMHAMHTRYVSTSCMHVLHANHTCTRAARDMRACDTRASRMQSVRAHRACMPCMHIVHARHACMTCEQIMHARQACISCANNLHGGLKDGDGAHDEDGGCAGLAWRASFEPERLPPATRRLPLAARRLETGPGEWNHACRNLEARAWN